MSTPAADSTGWFSSASFLQHPDVSAIAVLLVGLALAIGLSRVVGRLYGELVNRDVQIGARSVDIGSIGSQSTARRITFWVVTLLAMLLALRFMKADVTDDWRVIFVDYGSRALTVFIILLIGTSLAVLARDLLLSFSQSREATLVARSLQALILLFAFMAAFDQLGLDIFLFTLSFAVLLGVASGALALAFALGSRDYVANLVARSELQRIQVGDRIRTGEFEGVVSHVHRLGVDIATPEGTVSIPAKHFINQPYLKFAIDADD